MPIVQQYHTVGYDERFWPHMSYISNKFVAVVHFDCHQLIFNDSFEFSYEPINVVHALGL